MEIIDEAREAWFRQLLWRKLGEMERDRAKLVYLVAEDIGPTAVVRTIDAAEGLETPEPSDEFIAGYGLLSFFGKLTNDRMGADE